MVSRIFYAVSFFPQPALLYTIVGSWAVVMPLAPLLLLQCFDKNELCILHALEVGSQMVGWTGDQSSRYGGWSVAVCVGMVCLERGVSLGRMFWCVLGFVHSAMSGGLSSRCCCPFCNMPCLLLCVYMQGRLVVRAGDFYLHVFI